MHFMLLTQVAATFVETLQVRKKGYGKALVTPPQLPFSHTQVQWEWSSWQLYCYFLYEYNMHMKYSDLLVYEHFDVGNILDLQYIHTPQIEHHDRIVYHTMKVNGQNPCLFCNDKASSCGP